jgi:hypothetical protein
MQKTREQLQRLSAHQAFVPAFVLLLFIVNLIQSKYTGLLHDEAYYWFISKTPEWGYLHGPPLIAALTGAGYFLFSSEVGVRLASCISSAATVYLLYKLAAACQQAAVFGHCAIGVSVYDRRLYCCARSAATCYSRFVFCGPTKNLWKKNRGYIPCCWASAWQL